MIQIIKFERSILRILEGAWEIRRMKKEILKLFSNWASLMGFYSKQYYGLLVHRNKKEESVEENCC